MVSNARKIGSASRQDRLEQILQLRSSLGVSDIDIDCVYDESFDARGAEEQYFGHGAARIDVPQWRFFPESYEESLQQDRGRRTLSSSQERELFLRYNYARYRICRMVGQCGAKSAGDLIPSELSLWLERVRRYREDIVSANMGLVLAMARQTRIDGVEFTEIVSEGNMALLRAVEKFDVSRGFKFSTYACRAILKSFNRLASKNIRYRQHFPVEFDPELEQSDADSRRHEVQQAESVDYIQHLLAKNSAKLSHIERRIVLERFSIGSDDGQGQTLAQVGKKVGLTNERVRQLQNVALRKIKAAMDQDCLV